jgi:hypothetical protein
MSRLSVITRCWCLALCLFSPLTSHAFGQALGCGGIEPKVVGYVQGTLMTTEFTVTGVTAPGLTVQLANSSGTVFDTISPSNDGGGTWTFSVNSGILGLGVTSVDAWNVAANGALTLCDAAFLNQQTPSTTVASGGCGTAAGNWQFAEGGVNYGTLNLTESGSSLGGNLSITEPSGTACPGTKVTWPVMAPSTYDISDGGLSIKLGSPSPSESPGGKCVFATGVSMTGTIPLLSCNMASGTLTGTNPNPPPPTVSSPFTLSQNCPFPTGETSTFDTWESAKGLNTEAGFSVQLQPTTTNFAGRLLSEGAVAGSIKDACYNDIPDQGSAVQPPNPDSEWAITSSDFYSSDDMIGYSPAAVFYYRLQLYRLTGGTSFSCGFTLQQQMHMNSCGSATLFTPYGGTNSGNTNTLSSTITSTTVSSSRAGAFSPTLTFP